jgi:hypothetical protein
MTIEDLERAKVLHEKIKQLGRVVASDDVSLQRVVFAKRTNEPGGLREWNVGQKGASFRLSDAAWLAVELAVISDLREQLQSLTQELNSI